MISDLVSDNPLLLSIKKGFVMEVIPPIKDFFSIYTTAAFIGSATLVLGKVKIDDWRLSRTQRLQAVKDKEEFTNNSFLEIKEGMNKIMLEQGKMMEKEDAYDKFVDNKTFDLQTKTFNKRFDTIEQTAKENKNDLKKTIEENKIDLKDFITQSLLLIKKDK
tara:strand:- start:312 stop:797 length:486 start_codon:yes stop_codon:yes gene_type:complete